MLAACESCNPAGNSKAGKTLQEPFMTDPIDEQVVHFTLTDTEKKSLEVVAEHVGMTVASYVKAAVLDKMNRDGDKMNRDLFRKLTAPKGE